MRSMTELIAEGYSWRQEVSAMHLILRSTAYDQSATCKITHGPGSGARGIASVPKVRSAPTEHKRILVTVPDSGPPDPHLSESAKLNATIATLEQCERDFKLKVLSRALAEKAKLNDSYRRNYSDEESALSDGEARRRNNAVVRALRTTRPSHQGPPQVNSATRSSRLSMRDQPSRAGSHGARMAQLVEETVWKLDAYDKQPKRMRDKYYAYREWSSRNEGVVPMDIDAGGKPAAEPSTFPKSTTGSTNYDPSRDPRLQR